ncbi:MAG: helix-turn-helix transcriptional regulator [Agriterribacter sp.]
MFTKTEEKAFNKLTGQLVRNARESVGVKQEVLSNYLGFKSRISISNIESGKQNIPLIILAGIADYLKIPITSLVPTIDAIRSKVVNKKIERNIGKEGIADNDSLDKIKDFIRFTSNKK